jgi:hypothetical protein
MVFVHIAWCTPAPPRGYRSKRNYLYLAKYAGIRWKPQNMQYRCKKHAFLQILLHLNLRGAR